MSFEKKLTDIGLTIAEGISNAGKHLDTIYSKKPELEKELNKFVTELNKDIDDISKSVTDSIVKAGEKIQEEFKKQETEASVNKKETEAEEEVDSQEYDNFFAESDFEKLQSKNGKLKLKTEGLDIKMSFSKKKKSESNSYIFKSEFNFNKDLYSIKSVESSLIECTISPNTVDNIKIADFVKISISIKLTDKDGNINIFNPTILLTKDEYKFLAGRGYLNDSDFKVKRKKRSIKVKIETSNLPF